MQSPIEITDEEQYWLRSRDVSESELIGGDEYFSRHDVMRREDVTTEDVPETDSEAVREIDLEAVERSKVIGKWQVRGSAERVEALWPELLADAADGVLWAVKAMTGYGYREIDAYDEHVLTVYTPNYLDREDVDRVRRRLREAHGVTEEIYYKPDIYTSKGIVADTAEEFGLAVPARYVA